MGGWGCLSVVTGCSNPTTYGGGGGKNCFILGGNPPRKKWGESQGDLLMFHMGLKGYTQKKRHYMPHGLEKKLARPLVWLFWGFGGEPLFWVRRVFPPNKSKGEHWFRKAKNRTEGSM